MRSMSLRRSALACVLTLSVCGAAAASAPAATLTNAGGTLT